MLIFFLDQNQFDHAKNILKETIMVFKVTCKQLRNRKLFKAPSFDLVTFPFGCKNESIGWQEFLLALKGKSLARLGRLYGFRAKHCYTKLLSPVELCQNIGVNSSTQALLQTGSVKRSESTIKAIKFIYIFCELLIKILIGKKPSEILIVIGQYMDVPIR